MKISFTMAAAAVIALGAVSAATARDQIRVVGSSTVFPYSQAVAEEFANSTGAASPVIESTGTGGGMQIFCGGVGVDHADMTGASRAMKASEFDLCQKNGVTDITEALIGYDGLSIAHSRKAPAGFNFSLDQIFLAMAAEVPVDGKMVANPYKKWSEIDASLPDVEITVFGPPPTSGTRDAFVELAMHVGCKELDFVKNGGFDNAWVKENCSRMRQDGPFIEAGENDNLIVQRLNADANALGIFGYSFLYENLDTLAGSAINGVEPSADTIADFSYPIARPLYFYIKNAHRGVIPGMADFIGEFVSEAAIGQGGYLTERGLVSLPEASLETVQKTVLSSVAMERPGS